MAFNQQNLNPGTAFFRLMVGSVMTTYGTLRLLREPKSRSGKMLVLFGSMKAAEGATKFCPTKALGTIMENLASENANQGAQANAANANNMMANGTPSGQYASSGNTGQKSGNIMQMVGNIAQKLTSTSSSQTASGSPSMGSSQNSSSAGQNSMATNAQTIGSIAQTVAPQVSQMVKDVAGVTNSKNASGTSGTGNKKPNTNGNTNKKDAFTIGSNTKSASSSTIKQAASQKSDTKPQLDGTAKNTNLDSTIIDAVSKSGQKNISTPNILQ
ncbi:YgaP family membrane protein [Psychrobacillus psychrodurans]|uniref:YgaP family membrane protein n=1 Tax=Psychrobacillus psychrodurans TaxID=126157 RepID=UPI0008E6DD4A|nr:DUF2892 domain-containing protein [Psychrobacillus psychrodurans]MCZ8539476.1 DUF2892 domain-containing protein [Psychrobacillus psychrodurans]SFM39738.1 Protein of unknown function [Psychrobacillus psychrodurans]